MDDLPVHGDHDVAELERLGIAPESLIDASVNVSPFGPHPDVVAAVRSAPLDAYPDRRSLEARRALAASLGLDAERVVLGHGAAELLFTSVLAYGRGGGPLLVVGPTFSEPTYAARALGVRVVVVDMTESASFAVERDAIASAIERQRPASVYVCHPNNPSGLAMPTSELASLVRGYPEVTFLVDQAFLSLSTMHADVHVPFPDNAIVIRSLTKDHALPGLRVAYAIASPESVRCIERSRPSWCISSAAQAAVREAVRHPDHVARAREAMLGFRAALAADLGALGVPVVPSKTAYLLARTGAADALRSRLLQKHHVLVRSAASFGLPNHIRLAGVDDVRRARLVEAIRAELGS